MKPPKIDSGTVPLPGAASPRVWHRRPGRFFIAVFCLGLIVAGAERLLADLRSRLVEPGHGACWIWAQGDYGSGEPIAFFAVRDVELEAVGPARVAIAADEVYLLFINGHRVGSGGYRPRAPVDEYEISDFLQPGINRIVVELASCRGAGGLLAEIDFGSTDDAGRARRVVTDGDWQIYRRYEPALLGGWPSLAKGEAPKLWRLPPTGRWRLGSQRIRRPGPSRSYLAPARRRPLRIKAQHSESWINMPSARRRIPPVGPKQLYDWGEMVEGFLAIDLKTAEGEPGLLYLGSDEPPDPKLSAPDQVILPAPGRQSWTAPFPGRFRYALVIGVEPYRRIEVEVLEPDPRSPAPLAASPAPIAAGPSGVFGLRPPRAYSKVEEDVWGRLAGLSRKAG